MSAGTYNIQADQGATYSQTFTYRDSAGNLVDLTGFTARMQVRAEYDSASPLLDLTTSNGGITLGGALGTITLLATATQMAAFVITDTSNKPPVLICVYDLELIFGAVVTRLIQGNFTVSREVTR